MLKDTGEETRVGTVQLSEFTKDHQVTQRAVSYFRISIIPPVKNTKGFEASVSEDVSCLERVLDNKGRTVAFEFPRGAVGWSTSERETAAYGLVQVLSERIGYVPHNKIED